MKILVDFILRSSEAPPVPTLFKWISSESKIFPNRESPIPISTCHISQADCLLWQFLMTMLCIIIHNVNRVSLCSFNRKWAYVVQSNEDLTFGISKYHGTLYFGSRLGQYHSDNWFKISLGKGVLDRLS